MLHVLCCAMLCCAARRGGRRTLCSSASCVRRRGRGAASASSRTSAAWCARTHAHLPAQVPAWLFGREIDVVTFHCACARFSSLSLAERRADAGAGDACRGRLRPGPQNRRALVRRRCRRRPHIFTIHTDTYTCAVGHSADVYWFRSPRRCCAAAGQTLSPTPRTEGASSLRSPPTPPLWTAWRAHTEGYPPPSSSCSLSACACLLRVVWAPQRLRGAFCCCGEKMRSLGGGECSFV